MQDRCKVDDVHYAVGVFNVQIPFYGTIEETLTVSMHQFITQI